MAQRSQHRHIVPLDLGTVTLPPSHPRAADGICPIRVFAIPTPDGVIVVDTGPRIGHPFIDELYRPDVLSVVEALNGAGIDERDVLAVVNTHLHFDHCGQNHLLPAAPVWVTAAEVEAAAAEFYTVPEWADIEPDRRRLAADDETLVDGVRLLHTPGHTPGHLSVVVESDGGPEVIVGQTCYSCVEFEHGAPAETDMHEPEWLESGRRSLQRLRSLEPTRAYFSHDRTVYSR